MSRRLPRWLVALSLALVVTAASGLPPVPAYVVIKQGDGYGGSTVSSLNAPFTDGEGRVGFVAALADGQRMIWWNTGPVFFSGSALPDVLTGGESTMGVSNTGGFIYSPSVNGNDAVYTHGGSLLKRGDPIPPLPGLFSTFNSRPIMLPDGTAYWVGGSSPTQGSSTSTNRHLFKATDPTNPATIERVLGGGDVIAGKTVRTTASNFDFWISNNGLYHIHVLDMNVTLNEHVYLNGTFVAAEGDPTGQGDNWENFGSVAVNSVGNYIFSGDTNGPSAADAFVAYNNIIKVREGQTIDGVTLAPGATVRALSINDINQVVHIWGWGTGAAAQEHLFFGSGASLENSIRLLSLGDELDINGDSIADYRLIDFNASAAIGPGLDLAEDGYVYLDVDLQTIGANDSIQAIIRIVVPEPAALLLAALGVLVLRRR